MTAWTNCAECDDLVAYYAGSFYRCRSCGYESLRDPQPYDCGEEAYVAASVAEEAVQDVQLALALRPQGRRSEATTDAAALGLSLFSIKRK